MDFFNKAKESIANASKDITQKANDMSGLVKVTAKINELEKEYDALQMNLAENLLVGHYEEVKALAPEIISMIERNREDYETAKKEQIVLKGNRVCPNCGAEQDKTAVHCTVCGTNIEDAEKTIPMMQAQGPAKKFCSKCGAEIAQGARFCTVCGTAAQ
ncbi:MAG: zinc ribbon domain-containing protein [Lachnospiraceae bacterium]|nr:zinc ribbon domain-containing protein [Lachnospiraceae bacterium]